MIASEYARGACAFPPCTADGAGCSGNAQCCSGLCGAGTGTCTPLSTSCKTNGNPCTSGSVFSKLNSYFNLNSFTSPDDHTYGSAPRYLSSCRGADTVNDDASPEACSKRLRVDRAELGPFGEHQQGIRSRCLHGRTHQNRLTRKQGALDRGIVGDGCSTALAKVFENSKR